MSSLTSPAQCQCRWHDASAARDDVDDLADLPSSRRPPAFVLTVEFAGSSGEGNRATADDEGPGRESGVSIEDADEESKSLREDVEEVSKPVNDPLPSTSTSMLTVCRFDCSPVDRRHRSETTLSTRRRPSSPSMLSQPGNQNPQTHEKRQDWKALRMLSAILLAFIATWTPYNLFTVIQAFCTTCINPSLYAVGKFFSMIFFCVSLCLGLVSIVCMYSHCIVTSRVCRDVFCTHNNNYNVSIKCHPPIIFIQLSQK